MVLYRFVYTHILSERLQFFGEPLQCSCCATGTQSFPPGQMVAPPLDYETVSWDFRDYQLIKKGMAEKRISAMFIIASVGEACDMRKALICPARASAAELASTHDHHESQRKHRAERAVTCPGIGRRGKALRQRGVNHSLAAER